jgi:hypothetical protein
VKSARPSIAYPGRNSLPAEQSDGGHSWTWAPYPASTDELAGLVYGPGS